jgi:hypothetical protein
MVGGVKAHEVFLIVTRPLPQLTWVLSVNTPRAAHSFVHSFIVMYCLHSLRALLVLHSESKMTRLKHNFSTTLKLHLVYAGSTNVKHHQPNSEQFQCFQTGWRVKHMM